MVNKRQGAVTRRALRRPRFLRHDHPFSSACACGLRIDERREGGDGAPHPQRLSPPAARLRRAPAGRHAPVRGRRDSQGIPIIPSVLLAGTTPPAASEGECGRLFSPHARRDGGVNVDVRAPRTRPSGGGMVESGRIRWRYFQRYRWKYRQRNTVTQHPCRGRRPPARPSAAAADGRPGRSCWSCAGRSAGRRARASDPRPVEMGAGGLFFPSASLAAAPPAAGEHT